MLNQKLIEIQSTIGFKHQQVNQKQRETQYKFLLIHLYNLHFENSEMIFYLYFYSTCEKNKFRYILLANVDI